MKTIRENIPGAKPIKAWLGTKNVPKFLSADGTPSEDHETVLDVEDAALTQTKNIARLPFIFEKGIALMPDAHLGKGATDQWSCGHERWPTPYTLHVNNSGKWRTPFCACLAFEGTDDHR